MQAPCTAKVISVQELCYNLGLKVGQYVKCMHNTGFIDSIDSSAQQGAFTHYIPL